MTKLYTTKMFSGPLSQVLALGQEWLMMQDELISMCSGDPLRSSMSASIEKVLARHACQCKSLLQVAMQLLLGLQARVVLHAEGTDLLLLAAR